MEKGKVELELEGAHLEEVWWITQIKPVRERFQQLQDSQKKKNTAQEFILNFRV